VQKLEQFEHKLREQDRKRRTRDALGDETLVYYFNANNKNFRVFVGDVEPFNTPDTEKEKMLRVGDMFYNRQILKECTAVDPNNWRPILRTGCPVALASATSLPRWSVSTRTMVASHQSVATVPE
jgi:hypothetical protein